MNQTKKEIFSQYFNKQGAKKRILSLILTLCMLVSLVPNLSVPVSALDLREDPLLTEVPMNVGSVTIESPNSFRITVNPLASNTGGYSPSIQMRSYDGSAWTYQYQYETSGRHSNVLGSVTGVAKHDTNSSASSVEDPEYWLTPEISFTGTTNTTTAGNISNVENISSTQYGSLFGDIAPDYMGMADLINNTTGMLEQDGAYDTIIIQGWAPKLQNEVRVTLIVSMRYNSVTGNVDMARYTVSAENMSDTQAYVYGLSWNVDTYVGANLPSGNGDHAKFEGLSINKFSTGQISVKFPAPNTTPWVGGSVELFPNHSNPYLDSLPRYLYASHPNGEFVAVLYPEVKGDRDYPSQRFQTADFLAMGPFGNICSTTMSAPYYYNTNGIDTSDDSGHIVRYDPTLLLPGQKLLYGVDYGQGIVGQAAGDGPWLAIDMPEMDLYKNAAGTGYDDDAFVALRYGYGGSVGEQYTDVVLRMTLDNRYLTPHSSMTDTALSQYWVKNTSLSSGNTDVWELRVATASSPFVPGTENPASPAVRLVGTPVYEDTDPDPTWDGVSTPVQFDLVVNGYPDGITEDMTDTQIARLEKCDPVTLNGTIWRDINNSGTFEPSFEGIRNVNVALYNDSGLISTATSAVGGVVMGPDGIKQEEKQYIMLDLSGRTDYALGGISVTVNGQSIPDLITSGEYDVIFEHFNMNGSYLGSTAIEYIIKAGASAEIEYKFELVQAAVIDIYPHTGVYPDTQPPSPSDYVGGGTASVEYTTSRGDIYTSASPGAIGLSDIPYHLLFPAYSNARVTFTAPEGYRLANGFSITETRQRNNYGPTTHIENFRLIAGDLRLTGVSDTTGTLSAVSAIPMPGNPSMVQTTVTTEWADVSAQLDFSAWNDSAALIINPNRGDYIWELIENPNDIIKTGTFTATGRFVFSENAGRATVKVTSRNNQSLSHEMEIVSISADPPNVDRIYIARASNINAEITDIALLRGNSQDLVVVGVEQGGAKVRILNSLAQLDSANSSILTSVKTPGDSYNFTVTGASSGWTTITATYDGMMYTVYALVTNAALNTATLQILPNPVNLTNGGASQTLTYTVTFPNTANNVAILAEMVTATVNSAAIATIVDNKTMTYVSDGTTSVTAKLNADPSVTGTAPVNCATGGDIVIPDGTLTLQEALSSNSGGFIKQHTTAQYFAFFDQNSNGVYDTGETILPYGTANSTFASQNSYFSIAGGTTPNVQLTGTVPGVDKLTVTYIYNGTTHQASTDIVVYSDGYDWDALEVIPSPVVMRYDDTRTFSVQAVFTDGNNFERHTLPSTMYSGSVISGGAYVSMVAGTQNRVKANSATGEAVYKATINTIPSRTGEADILVIPTGAKLVVEPSPLWIRKDASSTVNYKLVNSAQQTLTVPNLTDYISASIVDTLVAEVGSDVTSIEGLKVGRTILKAYMYGQQASQDVTIYVWDDTGTLGDTGILWYPDSLNIESGSTGTSGVYLVNTDGSRGASVDLEHIDTIEVVDAIATIPDSPSGAILTVTGQDVTTDSSTTITATSPAGSADLTVNILTRVNVSGIEANPQIIELWPGETKTVTVKNTGTGLPLDESQLSASGKAVTDMYGTPTMENDVDVDGSVLKISQEGTGVAALSVNLLTVTYDGKATEVYIINYPQDPYANGNVRELTLSPEPVYMAKDDSESVSVTLTLKDSSDNVIDSVALPAAAVTWTGNTNTVLPGRIDISGDVYPDTISVTGTRAGAQTYRVTYSGGDTPVSVNGTAFVFAQSIANIDDFYFDPDAVALTPGNSKTVKGIIEYNDGTTQSISPQELPIAVPDLRSDTDTTATVSQTGIITAGNLNGDLTRETIIRGELLGTAFEGTVDVLIYDPNAEMRIEPASFVIFTPGRAPETQNVSTWIGSYKIPNHFLNYSVRNNKVGLDPDSSGDEYIVTGQTIGTDIITSLIRGSTKSATADVEVRGAFEIYYTVSYDANGGTGTINPVTLAQGTNHSVQPSTGFTAPSGYYFDGWNTVFDGTGTPYASGDIFTLTGNVTLYAQWSLSPPTDYTITYDANDGSVTPPQITVTDVPGTNVIIAGSNTFTAPSGKRFIKWSTDPNGTSGTDYNPGDTYALNSDITLYAIWEDEVTVTYDSNTGSGSMNPDIDIVGELYTARQNEFTAPAGKQFVEWNTVDDGTGTSYADDGTGTFTLTSDITLYAIWENIDYTVTYNGNNPTTGTAPTDSNTYILNESVTILGDNGMTKTGYTFGGWELNGTIYQPNAAYTITGNVTFNAVWTPDSPTSYTVTYNGNNPTTGTAPTDTNSPYSANATITILGDNGMTKTGYTFGGWELNGTIYQPNATYTITDDVTFNAVWTPDSPTSYTVTYNGNNPTTGAAPTDTNSPYSANATITILGDNGMTKAGYTFGGWELNGTIYQPNAAYIITDDVTFNAVWTPVTPVIHTVTYNANNGTGTTISVSVTDGTTHSVRPNSFTHPSGEYFIEWNTANDGSGTSYGVGASLPVSADITLYAQWSSTPPASYTVTYDANYTGGATTTVSDVPGATHTVLDENTFTALGGKRFAKWCTDPDGTSGTEYMPGDTLILNSPIVLYAIWEDDITPPAQFTLTVISGAGGSANTYVSGTYPAGAVIDITAVANSNYTFKNWTSTVSGVITNTSMASTRVTMPASDVTVTANFTSTGGSGWIIIPPFFPGSSDDGESKPVNTPPERPAKETPDKTNPTVPDDTDKTYTVTYKANEGIGDDYKVSGILSGAQHTVLDVVITKISYPDHVFTGWNTKADGTGTSYAPGEKLTVTDDTTLYAQWRVRVLLETDEHILYLNGYGDGTVKADNAITRAEAASIFYRLLKTQGEASEEMFNDVDSSKWYAKAVNYLASMGILTGYADGTFRPDAPITRAEFATIATRFDTLVSLDGENTFKDVPDTHWAVRYINAGVAKGWINGYGDGTFKPDDSITRAQVVKIVNAMLERKIDDAALAIVVNPYTDISKDHWAYAEIIEASVPHEYIRDKDGNEIWEY